MRGEADKTVWYGSYSLKKTGIFGMGEPGAALSNLASLNSVLPQRRRCTAKKKEKKSTDSTFCSLSLFSTFLTL